MNKRLYLLILILLLFTGVFASATVISAAEKEETATGAVNSTAASAATKIPKVSKGWVTHQGFKYYYKSSKLVTGWKKIEGHYYYFRKKADDNGPKGSMIANTVQKIKNKYYYFDPNGYLRYNGWINVKGNFYYLTPKGKIGVKGAAYIGIKKIDNTYFCFSPDGKAVNGWITVGEKTYYGKKSKKIGERGILATGWQTISGYDYFFNKSGVLQKNCWISKKYYVDSNGRKLKNTVTPTGYKVNETGLKSGKANGWFTFDNKKYYYVNGVKQTGWQTISDKKYHFDTTGALTVNTTLEGYTIDSNGVATPVVTDGITAPPAISDETVNILLIAGHGQGDSGATSKISGKNYYEYEQTRIFATLVYNALKSTVKGKLNLVMYDQNYDCYQVNAKKKEGPDPHFKNYDYILEIHLNASAESVKDPKGDGNCKGIGMYVNTSKTKNTTKQKKRLALDQAIIAAVHNETGFDIWGRGDGIFTSSTLLNARLCQEAGISYGLLETCFIDDKDDLTFYLKNRDKMAHAVANAICKYFNI